MFNIPRDLTGTTQLPSIFQIQIPGIGGFTPEQIKNLRDYVSTDTHDILVNKYSKICIKYVDPSVYSVLVNNYVPNWTKVNTLLMSHDALVGSDGIAQYWISNKDTIKYLVGNKSTLENLINKNADINSLVAQKDNLVGTDGIATYWSNNKNSIKYLINNKSTLENLINKNADINSIIAQKDTLIGTDGISSYWTNNKGDIKDAINFWKSNKQTFLADEDITGESYYKRWKVSLGLSRNYNNLKSLYTNLKNCRPQITQKLNNINNLMSNLDKFTSLDDILNANFGFDYYYGTVDSLLQNEFFSLLRDGLSIYDLTHPDAGTYSDNNPYWSCYEISHIFRIKSGGDILGLAFSTALGGVTGGLLYLLFSSESGNDYSAGFRVGFKNVRGAFQAFQYLIGKILVGDKSNVTKIENNYVVKEVVVSGPPNYNGYVFPANLNVSPVGDISILRMQITKLQMIMNLLSYTIDTAIWHMKRMYVDNNLFRNKMLKSFHERIYSQFTGKISQLQGLMKNTLAFNLREYVFPSIKNICTDLKDAITIMKDAIPTIEWKNISTLG